MKKCPGSSRFGFPLVAQRMAYYDDDSDVETDLSPEKSSLESANRELAAVQVHFLSKFFNFFCRVISNIISLKVLRD